MSTWFTSDLHLGHEFCAKKRGFELTAEHDWQMIENINKVVNKRDKLFILGDLAWSDEGLRWANSILCRNVELILGNHDKYPIRKYLALGFKIHGFRGYKDYWLSHCPIHPQEICHGKKGNIHGHIHKFGSTDRVDPSMYFCANPEYHNLGPVSLADIDKAFSRLKDETD